jgi:hypothetical protein
VFGRGEQTTHLELYRHRKVPKLEQTMFHSEQTRSGPYDTVLVYTTATIRVVGGMRLS